jgi:mannose-1-phosphate guanylyltransferase
MFFFRAGDMMAAIRAHVPELARGLDMIDGAAARSPEAELEAIEEVFPTLPSISIDHGVMEHVERLVVVPGDFGWNDIGSWQSAWARAQRRRAPCSSTPSVTTSLTCGPRPTGSAA